ncbi:unnamed protein product, partial [Closterium sp. NIES-54]
TYVDEVPSPGANIVDGFSQRQGVDYLQTFSPTPKMTTLRVLLHVDAQRDYELHSLDFSTAFLQGNLHEEISLRRPPGFTESFPAGTQWSLRRPVYGLRQAPRKWHDTLRTTLAALGFAPAIADSSLFLCTFATDTSLRTFYVLVYVDNLVFATVDTKALTLVQSEQQKRHTCTDMGELRSYLGVQIIRDRARRTITLTQSHMVHQVLQRFGFQFSSPQPTPLSTGHSLSAPPLNESVEPSGPYLELVGCLMYLMTCTRPDLVYPLSLLARYVAPGRHRNVHWDAAKRVLRYLCCTGRHRGAEPGGAESKGAWSGGAELGGVEPRVAEPGGADSEGADSGGAASSGGHAGASPRVSPRPEPLSPQQLRDWLVRRARLWSGTAGAGATGDSGDTGAGGAGVTAGAGGTGGTTAAGPGGSRTRVTRAARFGGVLGAGAGNNMEPGVAGARGIGAGAGAGGAGAGGTGAGGAGARGAGAVDPGAGGAGAGLYRSRLSM